MARWIWPSSPCPCRPPTTLCQELFRERLYLVVPENHRLASQREAHLKQIENDPFLLLKEGHCFRENTLSACGRARVQPNVVFESGQFTTILAMVAAGTSVFVVPEMAIEKRDHCRFIPLADENAFRRIGIVQLKQHFRSRVHRALLKHLQELEMKAQRRAVSIKSDGTRGKRIAAVFPDQAA